ncbi:FxSxx-COOH system tetratricopeptide repeat protein [Streptomyces sp. NPDC050804]|uniref:FxSxx-COOH system tetratricopeptide repeat protein n=1 Tax=Streptomyces sp. NPDC050804 TaxID=3154745 RepID=UPI00342F7918
MTSNQPELDLHIEASGVRSIAAQTIGTAFTGDVILPGEVLTAARDIPAPPAMSNLAPPGPFLGREDDLVWLYDTLASSGGSANTQAPTIHGLGGVGKSTLVLQYAHLHREDYTLIWWITADSPTRIEQSLAALTYRLFPAWAGTASVEQRVQWALAWLQWHPGWLLIMDNVEDPRHLTRYVASINGHFVVTSRKSVGWPRSTPTRAIGTLTEDHAANLLCIYAFDRPPTPAELQDAQALAVELDGLPLALEQAGAYLSQIPGITIDAYRRRLDTKLDKAAEGIDAERTIARIWTHTFEALSRRNTQATSVLQMLAWLASENIPQEILQLPNSEPDDAAEALAILRAYSMITLTPEGISIHRLVQTVLRKTAVADCKDEPPAGRREAEMALVRAMTGDLGAPFKSEWESYIPHLISLAETAPHGHWNDRAVRLYGAVSHHLFLEGYDLRTVSLRKSVLRYFERTVGDADPRTLTARNNLGQAYDSAGMFGKAIAVLEPVLAQRERVIGYDHPDTLTTRNNLANAYESAGEVLKSLPLYEANLPLRESVLGKDHPDTLQSRNNLGHACEAAGNSTRAISLHRATLSVREKTLGQNHPDTLQSRNNLAYSYLRAGKLSRAIELLRTTLAQRQKLLGESHPQTLATQGNLATAYLGRGDTSRAIDLLDKTLTQRERVLGSDHPHTMDTRASLGLAYYMKKEDAKAIPLLQSALLQYQRVYRIDHPSCISIREALDTARGRRNIGWFA